ncbi:hypothetical protein [Anaeromyxobacter paludicola]|uniref:Transposase n=1 Tax=Anaeromyxobacter paludicola TaxID=2918171 RepID=A0ABN6N6S7_9BACT|nr:hypothetical protein [Anaeromyxobacter paludicola]BDG08230.1 hypothetical protein AMPC_13430 [Anaeromyxobacter paludicola]
MPLDLSGNLLIAMKAFDDETRRRLATGWNPHACTAREYAASVGIGERTLRLWRARYLGEERSAVPPRHAGVPLDGTVEALQARLVEFEARLDAALAGLAACRAALETLGSSRCGQGGNVDVGDDREDTGTAALPTGMEAAIAAMPLPVSSPGDMLGGMGTEQEVPKHHGLQPVTVSEPCSAAPACRPAISLGAGVEVHHEETQVERGMLTSEPVKVATGVEHQAVQVNPEPTLRKRRWSFFDDLSAVEPADGEPAQALEETPVQEAVAIAEYGVTRTEPGQVGLWTGGGFLGRF